MKVRNILTGLVAALMTATPSFAGNTLQDHNELVDTLQEAGVTVKVNPRDCSPEFHGYYNRKEVVLAICQDNAKPGGRQVRWTANDLDTLRHEAQHVIQDCMVGGLGDLESDTYLSMDDLKEFLAMSTLTPENIETIIESYIEQGATEEVVIMELEAFAVATDIDAESISKAVEKMCMR